MTAPELYLSLLALERLHLNLIIDFAGPTKVNSMIDDSAARMKSTAQTRLGPETRTLRLVSSRDLDALDIAAE